MDMVIESARFYTRLKLPLHLQEVAIAGLFNETMCCQNLVLVCIVNMYVHTGIMGVGCTVSEDSAVITSLPLLNYL